MTVEPAGLPSLSKPTSAYLKSLGSVGSVIHIGAGRGGDLPALLASSAENVILVEPAPAALAYLRKLPRDDRVRILPVAVSDRVGQVPLRNFNLVAATGLCNPTDALRDIYPGLRELEQVAVDCVLLTDVFAEAKLDTDKSNLLIIDAPGSEQQIVAELLRLKPAERVSHVLLRAGRSVLYEGAAGFGDLCSTLQKGGYRTEQVFDLDPDFPEALFRLELLAVENEDLRAALGAAEAERATLQQANAEAEKQLAELRASRQALAELEAALAAEREQRIQAAKASEAKERDLVDRLEFVTKERDTLLAKVAEVRAALVEEQKERKTAAELAAQLTDRLAAADEAAAANASKLAEMEAAFEQHRAEQAKAASREAELKKRMAELDASLKARIAEVQTRDEALARERSAREAQAKEAEARLSDAARQLERVTEMQVASQVDHDKLAELTDRIEELEDELRQRRLRETHLEEEMIRAEAQITIVRELLPAFVRARK